MRQRDFDQIADTLRLELAFASPEEVQGLMSAAGALREAWHKQNANLDKERFDNILNGTVTEDIW